MDLGGIPIFFDGTTTWFSDKQQGLIAITLQPNYFKPYQFFDKGYSNSARGIFVQSNGEKWFSTINATVKLDANNQLSSFPFKGIMFTPFLKDKSNHLWSFDGSALLSVNLTTNKKQYFPFNHKQHHINLWSLYQSANGNIWNFGLRGELLVLNPTTGQWSKKSELPIDKNQEFNAYHIQKRDAQSVWVCSNQGLFVVDNAGNYLAQYGNNQKGAFYLPAIDFHHMYQDSQGVIWLATGDGGLIRWMVNDRQTLGSMENKTVSPRIKHETGSPFTVYRVEDGLSCNTLHAIYEDDYEYLWISSNDGLMQMDKRTGKFVTYTTEYGLLHNEFNRISHFQDKDGTIYFGGVTGVIAFHPKHFSKVRYQKNNSKLVVTNFQQFSDKNGQFEDLTYLLLKQSVIRLQPNDRFFKLNLALLNYQNGTTFQYRIKGVYVWQSTKNNELSISGLPYGEHQFEIKALNANQQEAINALTFPIHVLRPFYLQWWFIVVVLAMFGISTFYFVKWRTQQLLIFQETEQLRNLDKMKSRFFANISHELCTPITLILAPLTQLIKNHTQQSEAITTQQLVNIKANGQNLLNLVNEVLDLSKLEANKLELDVVPTRIPQFIERIVANFESAAAIKGIEYQMMSFLQKDIVAQFDQGKLEKILNNLLSNALKFTPKNGHIQIMVTQVEQNLVIKVKDSGRGISEEDLPYVFDRYFQTNTKNIEGGTGIGLALTKELMELMNGEISVKSKLGEGTEFEVQLPIELVRKEDLQLNPENKTKNSSLLNFKNLVNLDATSSSHKDTILLVEDNPSLQQFIQSILAPYYNVIITGNGVEALDYLTNYQSLITNHLILSDVMMPEMDGFTLLEKVKADDRFCSIPFILLTARADINDKLRGLRIGVDDYMTKPFEVDELLLRIKNLIANSKSRGLIVDSKQLSVESEQSTENIQQESENQQLVTHNPRPATVKDLQWLEKVEAIAQREVRNPNYKLDDLAHELLMSKSKLYQQIKKTTGLTPMKYLKLVKLQKAKQLLETTEVYTLTELCCAIGFENTTHFAKSYEKEFGKRPHDLLTKMVY